MVLGEEFVPTEDEVAVNPPVELAEENNMPLPKPTKGQKESNFISSCMSNKIMKREYPDNEQRLAVCFSQFRRRKKK